MILIPFKVNAPMEFRKSYHLVESALKNSEEQINRETAKISDLTFTTICLLLTEVDTKNQTEIEISILDAGDGGMCKINPDLAENTIRRSVRVGYMNKNLPVPIQFYLNIAMGALVKPSGDFVTTCVSDVEIEEELLTKYEIQVLGFKLDGHILAEKV